MRPPTFAGKKKTLGMTADAGGDGGAEAAATAAPADNKSARMPAPQFVSRQSLSSHTLAIDDLVLCIHATPRFLDGPRRVSSRHCRRSTFLSLVRCRSSITVTSQFINTPG